MKSQSVIIQMVASEQYFPVVLFFMQFKGIHILSLAEILKCDHLDESY